MVKVLFSIWQYFNLLWQISSTIGLIFIAASGHISKK